tara:strand:- start:623 stop:889 length:267 start_codon:yes stop_codon:yes gene_type:complete
MTLRKRNRRRQVAREKAQTTTVVPVVPETVELESLPVEEIKVKKKTTPKKTVRTCSVCKGEGHTKRSCPTLKEIKEEPPKTKWWQNKE